MTSITRKGKKGKDKYAPLLQKCKVLGCDDKARSRGFCFNCNVKFTRGYYDSNGEKSIESAQKEQEAIDKAERKADRKKDKQWKIDKQDFSTAFRNNPRLLRVLQAEWPGISDTLWCKPLEFWTCTAGCFGRMFTWDYVDEACVKCRVHDHKFKELKVFLKEHKDE